MFRRVYWLIEGKVITNHIYILEQSRTKWAKNEFHGPHGRFSKIYCFEENRNFNIMSLQSALIPFWTVVQQNESPIAVLVYVKT